MTHLLDDHGTKLHELKPAAIVWAAEADLRRRTRNRTATADSMVGAGEHCAFHRYHVRKAEHVTDLLAVALRDRQRGLESGKRWTRLIYRDEALLEQAIVELYLGTLGAKR